MFFALAHVSRRHLRELCSLPFNLGLSPPRHDGSIHNYVAACVSLVCLVVVLYGSLLSWRQILLKSGRAFVDRLFFNVADDIWQTAASIKRRVCADVNWLLGLRRLCSLSFCFFLLLLLVLCALHLLLLELLRGSKNGAFYALALLGYWLCGLLEQVNRSTRSFYKVSNEQQDLHDMNGTAFSFSHQPSVTCMTWSACC